MSTIKIPANTRAVLYEIGEDKESMDRIINRLLDIVEDDLVDDFIVGYSNINISKDTLVRIKSFKAYDSETYSHILHRALNLYMSRDNK